MAPRVIALVLSVVAVALSIGSAYAARRSRALVETLSRRYAEAIALLVLVARADPPLVAPELRDACERFLTEQHITAVTVTTERGRVH